jgi:hypothetical protein
MSRSGNVWDNAAMESFFSSLKTERTGRKTYRTLLATHRGRPPLGRCRHHLRLDLLVQMHYVT